jgi:hypothetical protein
MYGPVVGCSEYDEEGKKLLKSLDLPRTMRHRLLLVMQIILRWEMFI